MREARGREEWTRTSLVASILINQNRDPRKSKPVSAAELNPFAGKRTGRTRKRHDYEGAVAWEMFKNYAKGISK